MGSAPRHIRATKSSGSISSGVNSTSSGGPVVPPISLTAWQAIQPLRTNSARPRAASAPAITGGVSCACATPVPLPAIRASLTTATPRALATLSNPAIKPRTFDRSGSVRTTISGPIR
jgi:hypothetical protein